MSSPAPRGVPLPFAFAFTNAGVPVTSGITVTVDTVERASDGTEIVSQAGAAVPKGAAVASGGYYYNLPASENDRQRESYIVQATATGGTVDRATQWAIVRVDQGLFDARAQLPAPSPADFDGGALIVHLWHTWGGDPHGVIKVGFDLSGFDDLVLSVKDSPTDSDPDAILRVNKAVGLTVLNRAAATAGDGSLVLTGDNCGVVFTVVDDAIAAISASLDPRVACWQLTGVITSPASRRVLLGSDFVVRDANSQA